MQPAYGDACTVTPGLIKGGMYSFLIESKTVLWVEEPIEPPASWKAPAFFLAVSTAATVGFQLDGSSLGLVLMLSAVALSAMVALIISFTVERKAAKWRLFAGSGESPILIFSSEDAMAFEAQRSEIEQALLTRPQV